MRYLVVLSMLFVLGVAKAQTTIPPEVSAVISGGSWQREGTLGTYRIVLAEDGWEHRWTRLSVEWLSQPMTRDESSKLVARLEPTLPSGQGYHVLTVSPIHTVSGRTEVTVTAVNNMELNAKPWHFKLQLLGPGEVKVIERKGTSR